MRILHVIAQLRAFVANAKQRNGFRCKRKATQRLSLQFYSDTIHNYSGNKKRAQVLPHALDKFIYFC